MSVEDRGSAKTAETSAVQTPETAAAPKAKIEPVRKAMLRVKCTDRVVGGGLFDGDRKVRIPKSEDGVKVEGPVKPGSWLDCQMKAGLIVEVED